LIKKYLIQSAYGRHGFGSLPEIIIAGLNLWELNLPESATPEDVHRELIRLQENSPIVEQFKRLAAIHDLENTGIWLLFSVIDKW
jgi:hypothetical protein